MQRDREQRRIERWAGRIAAPAALLSLGGCHVDHSQSMLHPESGPAAAIAWLWWFLFAVCGVVFVIVMVLTAIAVFMRPRSSDAPPPVGDRFIMLNGALIPAVILLVILVVSVGTQVALEEPETNLTIRVTGYLWWWEVEYPGQEIVTANEIHIPVGEPVRLELLSADVIHSLWVPNLQGKTDLVPGITNTMWLAADRPGVYLGQCAEYCGVQHASMRLRVIALPRDEFDAWVTERRQGPIAPTTDPQRRGKEVFVEAKCHNCHAIGTEVAVGERGPDLTHIGSRKTLGAGLLPNNRGNLAGWIVNPQALKPGNLMPATHLEPGDLHALVEYLVSLQ